jgi:hypothetical protein
MDYDQGHKEQHTLTAVITDILNAEKLLKTQESQFR